MHTVIRTYSGVPTLADELAKHSREIKLEIGTVPGFVAYSMIQTSEGAATLTVCESMNACEETSRRAADWMRLNLPDLEVPAPQVVMGKVAFQFSRAPAMA
jgi:hypothetical protein